MKDESAFPNVMRREQRGSDGIFTECIGYPEGGLTKRELAAMMAMNAHFFVNRLNHDPISAEDVAKDAVACADALLKELSKDAGAE